MLPKVLQLRLDGCTSVLLCVDRERRSQCAPGLAADVRAQVVQRLQERGVSPDGVAVVVADRTFEAWILAGARELRRPRIKWNPPSSFEGKLGAGGKLGQVELGRLLGHPYDKLRDGPTEFGRLSLPSARARSRSLDKLLRSLVAG